MQERHVNRKKYFDEQIYTVEKHVLPLINEVTEINEHTSVLEIGCGEAGNLVPFLNKGVARVVGIDMSSAKIENAKVFFAELENGSKAEFICDNIYNRTAEDLGQFDVIMTRDVLEHIHGQDEFLHFVKSFLKPNGKFFLGFPPWQNPYGGHQQICKSKFLSKLPYYHILPRFMYKGILKLFKESPATIENLLEVKETGITIERFERIVKKHNYHKDRRIFYFINPNYEIKFGLKPRKCWKVVSAIPYIRNFFITTNYYIISKGVPNEK